MRRLNRYTTLPVLLDMLRPRTGGVRPPTRILAKARTTKL